MPTTWRVYLDLVSNILFLTAGYDDSCLAIARPTKMHKTHASRE